MSTIAIYGLSPYITRRKVDDLFYKFGKIIKIDAYDGIVFVTYCDYRDSQDAIRAINGRHLNGIMITVKQCVPKQKTVSFSDDTKLPFKLNVKNAKCSVNINEDGHGFIKIEF